MKLVVFDVDGTLIDSHALIIEAMETAFEAVGLKPPGHDMILSTVGLSLPEAIEYLLPGSRKAQLDEIVGGYRNAFLAGKVSDEAPLYPGARECLMTLAGRDDLLLGVATGKSRRGLDVVLEHHGLSGFFVTCQTADGHPSKPHPEMLFSACSCAGVDPSRTVMIGDTEFDMNMAKTAGTGAIGVSWGYHSPETLRQIGVPVAEDFPDLHRMIEEWAE